MLERRRWCAGREPEATPCDSSSSLRDAVDDDDSSECRVGDLRSERVGDDSDDRGRS